MRFNPAATELIAQLAKALDSGEWHPVLPDPLPDGGFTNLECERDITDASGIQHCVLNNTFW
ncbi:MAG: hypothetical protein OIF57_17445 [Marinobacterium sp.]|nr:hypothetical protein [Marinobacterium sp.]